MSILNRKSYILVNIVICYSPNVRGSIPGKEFSSCQNVEIGSEATQPGINSIEVLFLKCRLNQILTWI
jgi:hypothetical protein